MDYGVVLDVETTGLDPAKDRVIEIGLVEFSVEGEARPTITRCYGALQDPGFPLDPEIQRITGLSDDAVRGQSIDWSTVRSFLQRASVVVAHNADFDRKFIEAVTSLSDLSLHWACSMRHIDWRKMRFGSLGLNYLAADHGFVNPFPHRAIFDCATTFKLIAPHWRELIQRSFEREYLIRAVGSPYETKDILKQRGYGWDPAQRCWSRIVPESALGDERQFLAGEVYHGVPRHEESMVTR